MQTLLLAFADDLKFIARLHIYLPEAVQKDLERVGVWPIVRRMSILIEKVLSVIFVPAIRTINMSLAPRSCMASVTSYTDLGVIRSSDNTCAQHLGQIANKPNG